MTQDERKNNHHHGAVRNVRFSRKLQKLAPAKRRLDEQRRDLQIRGGHRLTSSLKMKSNQISFDHERGHILDLQAFLRVIAIFKPQKKVMGKCGLKLKLKLKLKKICKIYFFF